MTRKLSSFIVGFCQIGFISLSSCSDSTGSVKYIMNLFRDSPKNSCGALKSVIIEIPSVAGFPPPPGPESMRISQKFVFTTILPGTVMR